MIFKWGFKYFSLGKQLDYLKEHGIMLGSRMHNNRMVFLYMVKNFFVEVIYKNDSLEKEVEKLNVFSSVGQLNQYLEKEFKSAF
jgi:hypothetical protein